MMRRSDPPRPRADRSTIAELKGADSGHNSDIKETCVPILVYADRDPFDERAIGSSTRLKIWKAGHFSAMRFILCEPKAIHQEGYGLGN